jgi:23S rRNA (adenine-N6)-dimethyltransferase
VAGRASRRGELGQHFLAGGRLAAELVERAGVGPADLVVEIGAGTGVLTRALARRAGRVLAIEYDPRLAARLRDRLAAHDHVKVVTGDALRLPLPRRPFRVVANPPFGSTAALLRRLLDDPRSPLQRADLILQEGDQVHLAVDNPGLDELRPMILAARRTQQDEAEEPARSDLSEEVRS